MMCWPANLTSRLWRGHCHPEWLRWRSITSTKAREIPQIWKLARVQTKHQIIALMCKFLPTSISGLRLNKANGVNAPSCRDCLWADFIFPYPFALLKLWLHVVLDDLFSLVVISALYLIRGAVCSSRISCLMWEKLIVSWNTSISSGNIHAHVKMCRCEGTYSPSPYEIRWLTSTSPWPATKWANRNSKLSPVC